jgi:hypothetical protein
VPPDERSNQFEYLFIHFKIARLIRLRDERQESPIGDDPFKKCPYVLCMPSFVEDFRLIGTLSIDRSKRFGDSLLSRLVRSACDQLSLPMRPL